MTVNSPVPDTFEDTPAKDRDPEWFKRAVFYEVLVRSFQDGRRLRRLGLHLGASGVR